MDDFEPKLYHREVAWDDYFDYCCRQLINRRDIVLSEHAVKSFAERDIDKGYIFALLKYNRKGEIFEVEKSGKYIHKFVIRLPYDLEKDVCIVLRDKFDEETLKPNLLLVTAWFNSREDNHSTLDASKYESEV